MERTPEEAYTEALRRIKNCCQQGWRGTALALSHLGLTSLPPEVGQLIYLTVIDLAHNKLTTLPPQIGHLRNLRLLGLAHNKLRILPPEIGNLESLMILFLNNNNISILPTDIGKLIALEDLDLSNNSLDTLASTIGDLAALKMLDLRNNQVSILPKEIGKISTLKKIYLNSNQLVKLPSEIGQLRSLQELFVGENSLAELPMQIGQLTRLTVLYLTENKLTMLPQEIRNLTALQELYLHFNPGLGLLVEMLGPMWNDVHNGYVKPKRPGEILASYFRIMGEAGEPLGECKLIVVGRGGAGKTSLIKRLRGEPYDPKEVETHGITIQKLDFDGNKGHVTGRVWDFGGQVVLHSMHEFFLTARSLYLLVLGERDDMVERDAEYWLQLIRSYAGDAPVVVALNKSAGRQPHFDRKTLEQNYGPILDWIPTECSETNDLAGGITALRKALTAAIDSPHMDSVRRKFPKKWRDIKAELEGMHESYLDYPVYTERCRLLGEKNAKEQEALARDLHDLGVALNYAHDPRLHDTTILRPDWLANGIYAVLRANDLDERLPPELNVPLAHGGVITASSLEHIHAKAEAWKMLQAADYPASKREFLLRLMEMFHLSYPLDDDGREQLVPTLLPLNPPEGTDEPDGPECVRLRYEFQVVPAPLMPWFIARSFALIPDRLHWRRGAILAYEDARAKVWATQDERFVFVTVVGPEHARQSLLAMIRGTLYKIFREYKSLHPVEQWKYEGEWVPRKTLEGIGVLPRAQDTKMEGESLSEEVES